MEVMHAGLETKTPRAREPANPVFPTGLDGAPSGPEASVHYELSEPVAPPLNRKDSPPPPPRA